MRFFGSKQTSDLAYELGELSYEELTERVRQMPWAKGGRIRSFDEHPSQGVGVERDIFQETIDAGFQQAELCVPPEDTYADIQEELTAIEEKVANERN